MLVCIVAMSASIAGDESPSTIANVLRNDDLRKVVKQLEVWAAPLTADDIAALEAVVTDPNEDWRRRYSAARLLRKHDPLKYGESPATERAQDIFLSVGFGKGGDSVKDEHLNALVVLGNDVV